MVDEPITCEGRTLTGQTCKLAAMPGSRFCAYHDPSLTYEERRRLLAPKWPAAAVRAHPDTFR